MREFFHGWRRKAGCITLVMACVVTAVWVRSHIIEDVFVHSVGAVEYYAVSGEGQFSIAYFNIAQIGLSPHVRMKWVWLDVPYKPTTRGSPPVTYAFGTVRVIPYWSLVLPLTLLAAYLILWKSRPKERRDA